MKVSYIILVVGEILLAACFYICLAPLFEPDLFWLSLVMAMITFGVFVSRYMDFGKTVKDFEQSAISFGQRWYGSYLFAVLEVSVIFASLRYALPFRYALMAHLVLLFLLVVVCLTAHFAQQSAAKTHGEIAQKKQGLLLIKQNLSMLRINLSGNAETSQYIYLVDELAENVRFISPSYDKNASLIETRIAELVSIMARKVEYNSLSVEELQTMTKQCQNLIATRKSII